MRAAVRTPDDDVPSYLGPRPRYRGMLHAVGAFVVVPFGVALVMAATTGRGRWAAGVYVLAQLAVFGTSASYHRLAHTPSARRRMQMADHSMIYVLITGTWVPLCLLAMPPERGRLFLIGIATVGAIGIVLKVSGVHRFPRSSNAMYVVMGWAGVLALPTILTTMSASAIALLVIGGLSYTAGAVVLLLRRPDPLPTVFGYHEIWHACTLLAAACHFAMVWQVTV